MVLLFLQEKKNLPVASLSSKVPECICDIKREKTGMCFTLLYYLEQAGLINKINSYWQNTADVKKFLVLFRYWVSQGREVSLNFEILRASERKLFSLPATTTSLGFNLDFRSSTVVSGFGI